MSESPPRRCRPSADLHIPPECRDMIRRGALVAINSSGGPAVRGPGAPEQPRHGEARRDREGPRDPLALGNGDAGGRLDLDRALRRIYPEPAMSTRRRFTGEFKAKMARMKEVFTKGAERSRGDREGEIRDRTRRSGS